jgi:TldD protein
MRYVNSEGSIVTKRQALVQVVVQAATQAIDGVPASDVMYVNGRTVESLKEQKLTERVQELASRLVAMRNVKREERYNGPVLFEGQAAGQLIQQVFAPAIIAARLPVSDTPQLETGFRQFISQMGGGSLADRIGSRVMPEWIDVADKPLESEAAGSILLGRSLVDDEAVKTHEVTIVERGILKSLLATRTPSAETTTTTGSAHTVGAAPTNIFVTARKALPKSELRKELLRLAKERGLDYAIVIRDVGLAGLSWVRRMGANFDPTGSGGMPGMQMYKIYPDGREELIRDLDFTTFSVAALKDIVAAGEDVSVNHSPFIPMMSAIMAFAGGGGAPGDTQHLVSCVTPSLLLDDVSLKRTSSAAPNPPVVESPLLATRAATPAATQ